MPRYATGHWRRVFPASGFGSLDEAVFGHAHVGLPGAVIVDRFLSVSFITALPATERAAVEQRLRIFVETEPALAGRETVAMPYRTVACRCCRLP